MPLPMGTNTSVNIRMDYHTDRAPRPLALKVNGRGTYTSVNIRMAKHTGRAPIAFADGRVWIGLWSDNNFVSGKRYAPGEAPSSEGPYSGAVPSLGIDAAKAQCEDLGFNKGTEAFGECVLKLIR